MRTGPTPEGDAIERYLLLIDISGYTRFLAGVEQTHGEDFSAGLPAGYRVLGDLIQGVIDGLPPDFKLVKVEGDAVFGTAPAELVDGQGTEMIEALGAMYRTFYCTARPHGGDRHRRQMHGVLRRHGPRSQGRDPPRARPCGRQSAGRLISWGRP